MLGGGRGVGDELFPTFDAGFKSQIPYTVGGGGGGGVGDKLFPTFDADSKSPKIPNSLYVGGGVLVTNFFQLLMLTQKLLKSQIPHMVGGGGGGGGVGDEFFLTFDADSKSAESQTSLRGDELFQFLMLAPNLLKSQIPYTVGGGVGDELFPTFDADSKSAKIPNSLYVEGGGGGVVGVTNFFRLLMLTQKLLKSQIPYTGGSGGVVGGVGDELFLTFDADSKSAKIPNSL